MEKPTQLNGFDPNWFEDQVGNLHRKPFLAPVHIRLSAAVVLVHRSHDHAERYPPGLFERSPWRTDRLDLAGGGVDSGESLAVALRRELKEELGLNIEVPESVVYATIERSFVSHVGSCEQKFCHAIVSVTVLPFPVGQEIIPDPEEVHDVVWIDMDPAQCPIMLNPMLIPLWPWLCRMA